VKHVKPIELLSALDAFAGLTPRTILSHPAWGVSIPWNGAAATLRADVVHPTETLNLSVRFGDDSCVLGLAPSSFFPEVSKLLPVRGDVPQPILLAVVEKEAGPFLQMLENVIRRELSVQGLAETPADDVQAFRVVAADGTDAVTFSLTLSDSLLKELGDLRRLDCTHPSIAETKVSMEVEYAVFDLTSDEEAGLSPGDYLLLPELSAEKPGRVCMPGSGSPDRLRVVAAERVGIPFATALQDDFRCAPVGTDDLLLMKGGRRMASGRLSKLGEQPAFAVEALC
jgi:hypothetical protein